MPAIKDRTDGSMKRKERLARLKHGPGTFAYNGRVSDVAWVPTVKLSGREEPVFDDDGLPRSDSSGRQIYKPAGIPVLDDEGRPVLGGPPKVVLTPMQVFNLRGIDFPAGQPVSVTDPALALKLRGMDCFDELDEGVVAEPYEERPNDRDSAHYWDLVKEARALGLDVPKGSKKFEVIRMLEGMKKNQGPQEPTP